MSIGFIKYLRNSERAKWLRRMHPNAFLLLSLIAERARRTENLDDGRQVGEAEIGDFKEAGIKTEKQYRTAKIILENHGFVTVVSTQKKKNQWTGTGPALVKKGLPTRATKRATNGTLVKLVDNTVWDINSDYEKEDRATKKATIEGDQRATEGRPKGDKQERKKEKKEEEEEQNHPSPNPLKGEDAASPLEGGIFEKPKGKRKTRYRHDSPLSADAITFQKKSVEYDLPVSADLFQKYLDEYDKGIVQNEYNLMLRSHKAGQRVNFDPGAVLGFRLSKYRKKEQKGKVIDIQKVFQTSA